MKFKKRDWDRLLGDVEDGKIVPVIGPDLLAVEVDGEEINLFRHVTKRLVEDYELEEADLPENYGLNEVVNACLQEIENDRYELNRDIKNIVTERAWKTPDPLKKLAEISPFKVFISVTTDSLMEQALNEVRFGGEDKTETVAFGTAKSKKEGIDLPDHYREELAPAVFHVYGRADKDRDFAIADEDILNFTYHLQLRDHRPNNLFDLLRSKRKSLLTLGCSLPSWLTRIFLAVLKGEEFFSRGARGLLADKTSFQDKNLVMFLERNKTDVYGGDAVDFVDELHRRWMEKHGGELLEETQEKTSKQLDPDFVFVSFHSGDRDTAREVSKAFEAKGVEVWLDEADLEPGVAYESEIERNIKNCSYFFPLISNFSVSGERRFFQFEWKKAIREADFRAEGYPFIQPIIVDDTPPEHGGIPEHFKQRHCQWLKNLDELVELTVKRLREKRTRAA